jgi:hypothetical protein
VLALLLPLAVLTITLAVPALPAGVVQVTAVSLLALGLVQALPPMVMPVALRRLLPLMVTLVPPAVLPVLGVMPLTLGPL